jgi:hypothetical protein
MTQSRSGLLYGPVLRLCLAIAFSFSAVLFCLKATAFQIGYFDSDTLYLLDYFRSLKDGMLSTFNYSHSPNLIPGGIVVVPLLAAGVNWQIAYAVYSSAALLVLVLSTHQIYVAVEQRHQDQNRAVRQFVDSARKDSALVWKSELSVGPIFLRRNWVRLGETRRSSIPMSVAIITGSAGLILSQ